jgi:hypothetical protein
MFLTVLVAFVATLFAQQAPPASPTVTLDYDYFKTRVQPIFLNKKPGNARCYVCHRGTGAGNGYLQVLLPGATTWDEEQSRKNFDAVRRFVVPGAPTRSRLLMHPLAEEAGGDEFHGGGRHWTSQDNPEWKILAAWVSGQAGTR